METAEFLKTLRNHEWVVNLGSSKKNERPFTITTVETIVAF